MTATKEKPVAPVQMVKNFTAAQNLTLFKEQVYQTYDFLQTSDPGKWLGGAFLKAMRRPIDQVEGDL